MNVKKGSKIKVEYEGKLDNGEIFDSSQHGDHSHPLEFVVGEGQVITGFEKVVVGMKKGDEKEFEIEPQDAYGGYNDRLKKDIPKSALPQEQEPKEGMVLLLGTPDGRQFPVKISGVDKENITVDFNHPLAGKKLHFKIKVVEVQEYSGGKHG